MMKINIIITALLLNFCIVAMHAQLNSGEGSKALTLGIDYIGDVVNNFSGGIKTGSCYLGMASLTLNFNTTQAGLWKGGSFFIHAANTHGKSPSSHLLGDMQVASNIDAGNHTYLQEFWFKQAIGKLELTVGLQDLNIEFANSAYGALFMNSSFGILPVISSNVSASIFPLTTLGITTKWEICPRITWLNAVYDGSPTDFDYNPYNLKWNFNSDDGVFAISELQYQTDQLLEGTYKIGVYFHNHTSENCLGESFSDNKYVTGWYAYADQEIWKQKESNLGCFVQLGYSPSKVCANDYYVGMGLNYSGLVSKEGKDVLGIALAHQHFASTLKSETAVELTYQYALTEHFFIQPDIQYIIHPAGTGEILANCFAGNMRFGITF